MNEQVIELQSYIKQVCEEKMNMEVPAETDAALPIEQAFDLDSISMFELIVNLEEKYGTRVPETDIEAIGKMNLSELVAYLEGQKANA
ncbi:acyl carrier protein [Marinicrinis sediminis]|uniref:Acyl carrier protein n=1 Tax=Marinicrinis sediminis TaxID=1652465 RepID=A0ABW5R9R0_9BACL